MALQISLQPISVLVPEGSSSVTFTTSGADPGATVTYNWRRKNVPSSSVYLNFSPTQTNRTLTLSPLAEYDNDTFVVLVSSNTVTAALTSNEVTFGIRLTGDSFSNFETLTESGPNRRRRLVALGYV
jgi:hypothetical protein